MTAVGFEPTQLALVELESTPLDHSGKLSMVCATHGSLGMQHCFGVMQVEGFRSATISVIITYSLRGLNPRPMAHKTIALTTELRELEESLTANVSST